MSFSAAADRDSKAKADPAHAVRVMLVDDSALLRALVTRWLNEEPDMTLAGSFADGRQAVEAAAAAKPDVILLDVEMPEMDGLKALPRLLGACPAAKVLMVSALTQRNAQVTFQAMSLGAVDYLPKPVGGGTILPSQDFRRRLIAKVRALGGGEGGVPGRGGARGWAQGAGRAGSETGAEREGRPLPATAAEIVLIGSSTGGPQALLRLLMPLRSDLNSVPVLVTQHMPPIFTAILAERISQATGLVAKEGQDGEVLRAGRIYVAPGERHMLVRGGEQPRIAITDEPPVNFHRPSADLLLKSAASVYGAKALAVILSGMGSDGTAGARAIVDTGGCVLVQDQASSVVWGMPGNVAMAGLASAELPPEGLAAVIRRQMPGGKS